MVMGKGKGEKCRSCGSELGPGAEQESQWYPFCSERCRLLDLGAWFDEEYGLDEGDLGLGGGDDPKEPKSDEK